MLAPENTVAHYENFPVASFLLPKKHRAAVASIYHFARYADDLADEGELTNKERLKSLAACQTELESIQAGEKPKLAVFQALAENYQQSRFPLALCFDLLSAFRQDVVKSRYDFYEEVLDYCRRSANPVGRLLLHLFGYATPENMMLSDKICTSLQWVNFLQDVVMDAQKNRIYFPREDLQLFAVTEKEIKAQHYTENFAALMQYTAHRTRVLLHEGAALGKCLPGRIGLEIRMIIWGAEMILRKLIHQRSNIFQYRPTLTKRDWCYMLYQALRKKLP